MESITKKQLNMAISRQFNLCIKKNGESLSKSTLANRINPYINCVHENSIEMHSGWREFIKTLHANYDYSDSYDGALEQEAITRNLDEEDY